MNSTLKPSFELWDSPHRLYFLLAALWAMLAMGLWLLQLLGLNWLSHIAGGALLWHAHELAFGFSSLAIIGFILTAVPEFTQTPLAAPLWLKRLAWIWCAGRLAYLLSIWLPWSMYLAAMADTALLLLLLWLIAPSIWQQPERRHLSFVYTIALLMLANGVFYFELNSTSLMLLTGVLMVLILVALARISMSVVNDQLEEINPDADPYLARPPRRNLAILCIGLYSLVAFLLPHSDISGWLALACAAAILNILNDWHIGKVLLRRWVLIPYLILWVMAAGYAIEGVSILAGLGLHSVGQHLLLALAMTLAILYVLLVAGGNHSGFGLDWRAAPMWVLALFSLTVGARALALIWPAHYFTLLMIGGTGWLLSWALLLPLVWRTLTQKPALLPAEGEHCKV